MLDLVNRILNSMNRITELPPKIMLKAKIEREIDAQYLSGDKIFERFGWKPKVNLDEGLRETVAWYASHFDQIV